MISKTSNHRRRLYLGLTLIFSAALMVWLLCNYFVKTCVVSGIIISIVLVLGFVTHPIEVKSSAD